MTRSIGVSNFQPHHLDAVVDATGVVPAINQVEIHPSFAQPALLAYHRKLGIATEAWGPLGQGKGELEMPGLVAVAQEVGRSPAQVAIRWHLQRGVVTIPKSVTPSRIAENLDVFDFELTSAQMAAIDALDRNERGSADPDTFDRR